MIILDFTLFFTSSKKLKKEIQRNSPIKIYFEEGAEEAIFLFEDMLQHQSIYPKLLFKNSYSL